MERKAWRAFLFLLLTGVLLLALAAMPTAATSWDTKDFKVVSSGEGESLDDTAVVDDVDRHGHDRGQCQKLCSHFHDYHRKMQCLQRCLHGLQASEEAVDGSLDAVVVVDDVNRHGHDRGQCQKLCSHFHDYHRKMQCLQRCLHGPQLEEDDGNRDAVVDDVNRRGHDRGQCEKLCSHFHDYHRKMVCLQRCLHGLQQAEEDGGSRDAVVDDVNRQEDGVSLDDDVNRHGHDRGQCQKLCSHFHDYHRKMQCLQRCLHGLQQSEKAVDGSLDAAVDDVNSKEDGESRDAVVDDVNRHGHDRGQCQKLCSHFHDYHRKMQCLQRCLHGSLQDGGADDEIENRNRGGGDRCEKQCQHYHDYDKRQQCVHHCRGGGGHAGLKTTTVVGAILEVV